MAKKKTETPETPELSLEQALALIAELKAQVEAKAAPAPAPIPKATPEQLRTIAQLQAALIGEKKKSSAAKRLAESATDESVYEVTNMVAATVSVSITDRHGNKTRLMFETKGSAHFLTASQVAEVRDGTDFFAKGYLVAPDVLEPSPNAISDFEAFITALDPDSVREALDEIDNPDVLWGLYHHIEGKRYSLNENELVQQPIDTKSQMVLYALIDRIRAETGINISANDAE